MPRQPMPPRALVAIPEGSALGVLPICLSWWRGVNFNFYYLLLYNHIVDAWRSVQHAAKIIAHAEETRR
jgi:hypothetical protein